MRGTQTLFNWSLRSDSRSIYPHIIRAAFAGLLLLSILAAWADAAAGAFPGLSFFRWICGLNVLLISVAGISYFVTAVTEEKDAGTLALLRLAGVSPLAIVLSKSTSRLISSLMLLTTQLPFVFLAITLGGVTWKQILVAWLALAAYLCMVANTALLCSVRCQTSGRAASLATAVLLLFFSAGPILRGFAGLSGLPWVSKRLTDFCTFLHDEQQRAFIVTRLDEIFAGGTVTWTGSQFFRNVAVGVVMFVLSLVLFNRYSEPAEDAMHGRSARVRRFTVGRCWRLPIVWKDFLFLTGGREFLIVKSVAYALMLWGFGRFHKLENPNSADWLSADLTYSAIITVTVVLTIETLLYSSNSLFQEVRQQTLAPLRMLPIETPVTLLQKSAAALLAMLPGFVTLGLLLVYCPNALLRSNNFAEMAVSWLYITLLSSHLTVLLSLYMRWAALPLAVLITFVSFGCFVPLAAGLGQFTRSVAALNGIPPYVWIGVAVNFLWMWLFILLPIEIEIVARWNRLTRES
ncbi:MAG: ABC transporter permease subunit [Planctomycetaceae bacterium]|nr:ABC transporter permease subunit [Planctomycetaceae bacterium]